jgi:hypothetical protein
MEAETTRVVLYIVGAVVALIFTVGTNVGVTIWKLVGIRDAIFKYVDQVKAELDEAVGNVRNASIAENVALINRVGLVEDSVIRLERDIAHLPDKDITYRLELAIAQLNGKVEVMSERLKPVSAIAERLQEAELERVREL